MFPYLFTRSIRFADLARLSQQRSEHLRRGPFRSPDGVLRDASWLRDGLAGGVLGAVKRRGIEESPPCLMVYIGYTSHLMVMTGEWNR